MQQCFMKCLPATLVRLVFSSLKHHIFTFFTDDEAVLGVEESEPVSVSLEDILKFTTGTERIPPLGFTPRPHVQFLHDDQHLFPEANTCAHVLKLPIHKSYEDFSDKMIAGIIMAPCFGHG